MRRLAAIVVGSLLAAGGACAQAASPETAAGDTVARYLYAAKGGVLAHDVGDLWSGTHLEPGVTFNGELVFAPHLDVLWGSIRPNLGASVATAGGTSYGYAGAVYEVNFPSGFFFNIGVGGAVHDGDLRVEHADKKALGSRVLFHIPIEAGIEFAEHYRVAAYFEHVSNGYFASPNEGLDNLGLRVAYRF